MTLRPDMLIALASVSLLGIALLSAALLKGWQGWLALKRSQIAQAQPAPQGRLDVQDLKERVRRLEAIANGVEA